MSARVGVLHTVPALAPVFDTLLRAQRDDLDIVHMIDASLLSSVVADGMTEEVRASLRRHLRALHDAGAESVLVTCSSIGEAAVEAASEVGVALHRVDAPMAAEAVNRAAAGARRILVLATLDATLGPTTRLVEAAAARVGPGRADSAQVSVRIAVESRVVAGAAEARTEGDLQKHDALIARAVTEASDVDAIVLAQASMASGAGDDPRVLTSPESGAAAFADAIHPPLWERCHIR